jgi:PAT family beta-lactamase induction signal transducer AmpG
VFFIVLLSATQDIAVDAYRTDVLAPQERGRGAAFFVTGYRVAMIASGALALWLSAYWSWAHVYWAMAAIMAASAAATFLAPTPEVQGAPPPSVQAALVEPFQEFLRRRFAIPGLAFVLLYKFGDALAGPLMNPFLLDTGFTKPQIALIQNGIGLAATIGGAIAGGWALDRMPLPRALLGFGVLQALANAGYLLIAATGPDLAVLTGAILFDNLCNGLGTAAFVACVMALCDRRFSAAQYALLTSLSSVLGHLVGAATGYLVAWIGWPGLFALSIACGLPALFLVGMLPIGEPERAPGRALQEPAAPQQPVGKYPVS